MTNEVLPVEVQTERGQGQPSADQFGRIEQLLTELSHRMACSIERNEERLAHKIACSKEQTEERLARMEKSLAENLTASRHLPDVPADTDLVELDSAQQRRNEALSAVVAVANRMIEGFDTPVDIQLARFQVNQAHQAKVMEELAAKIEKLAAEIRKLADEGRPQEPKGSDSTILIPMEFVPAPVVLARMKAQMDELAEKWASTDVDQLHQHQRKVGKAPSHDEQVPAKGAEGLARIERDAAAGDEVQAEVPGINWTRLARGFHPDELDQDGFPKQITDNP